MSVLETTKTRQYLTFSLAGDLFAADVARVREILELVPITRVPGTPDAVRGVINVRGSVVPVVDLRRKFGLAEREATIDTCIVVMEVETDEQPMIIGAIVDSVLEVLDLAREDVQQAPRIGNSVDAVSIQGIGRYNDGFVIILDVDHVFTASDLDEACATKEESLS